MALKISAAKIEPASKAGLSRMRWLLIAAIIGAMTGILLMAQSCMEIDVVRSNNTIRVKA